MSVINKVVFMLPLPFSFCLSSACDIFPDLNGVILILRLLGARFSLWFFTFEKGNYLIMGIFYVSPRDWGEIVIGLVCLVFCLHRGAKRFVRGVVVFFLFLSFHLSDEA